ncbi:MAG: hypothetical protein O4807_15490 [Trichodesmium sp. St19_bin2]|nr:hypothetical protein [Trichodesmium sp. St19_bin2]
MILTFRWRFIDILLLGLISWRLCSDGVLMGFISPLFSHLTKVRTLTPNISPASLGLTNFTTLLLKTTSLLYHLIT